MWRGGTIFHIAMSGKPFKKLYGIEANQYSFEYANKLIEMLNFGGRIHTGNYLISKNTVTFGELYLEEDISLICLDVEGAEIELLQSAEKLCKKYSPVLAISFYHKKEDIIEITKYIRSLGDYKFYVRKYESYNAKGSTGELVLYAVPKYRIIREDKGGS